MRRALWLPLAAVLSLALPAVASACSCARAPEGARFRAADGAFVGTLVSRHALEPPAPDGSQSTGDPFVHRYRVDRRYKGRIGPTVWVRTVRSDASCGLPHQGRIALYLERVRGHWRAGSCEITTRRAMRAAARHARGSSFPTGSQGPESALEQGFCPSSKGKGLLE